MSKVVAKKFSSSSTSSHHQNGKMDVDQESVGRLSHTIRYSSRDESSCAEAQEAFPFMLLPLELRRKIYLCLLPPQTHKITTHFPTSGYFYNTSNISTSLQSTYPFGQVPEKHHVNYSASSSKKDTSLKLFPEILRVSKDTHAEAEDILYGAKGVIFDFGIHVNVISSFLKDRSESARFTIKEVRLAREVPRSQIPHTPQNELWYSISAEFCSSLKNLKFLNLVLWSDTGSSSHFPRAMDQTASTQNISQLWREWHYTRTILNIPGLRRANIMVWDFPHAGLETLSWSPGGREGFDGWLARKMVDDAFIKERMIKDGVLGEERIVVTGFE